MLVDALVPTSSSRVGINDEVEWHSLCFEKQSSIQRLASPLTITDSVLGSRGLVLAQLNSFSLVPRVKREWKNTYLWHLKASRKRKALMASWISRHWALARYGSRALLNSLAGLDNCRLFVPDPVRLLCPRVNISRWRYQKSKCIEDNHFGLILPMAHVSREAPYLKWMYLDPRIPRDQMSYRPIAER